MAQAGKGGKRPAYGTKRRITHGGYVHVYEPGHPLAFGDGYVPEHRKVAWDAGLLTDTGLHVHHLNGDRTDNRLENLQVLSAAEHQAVHHPEQPESYHAGRRRARLEAGERACVVCGADITARRVDAVVCGSTCRVTHWKREKQAA